MDIWGIWVLLDILDIIVQFSVDMFSFLFDEYLRAEVLSHRICMFNFIKNCQSSLKWLYHLQTYWECMIALKAFVP